MVDGDRWIWRTGTTRTDRRNRNGRIRRRTGTTGTGTTWSDRRGRNGRICRTGTTGTDRRVSGLGMGYGG